MIGLWEIIIIIIDIHSNKVERSDSNSHRNKVFYLYNTEIRTCFALQKILWTTVTVIECDITEIWVLILNEICDIIDVTSLQIITKPFFSYKNYAVFLTSASVNQHTRQERYFPAWLVLHVLFQGHVPSCQCCPWHCLPRHWTFCSRDQVATPQLHLPSLLTARATGNNNKG